MGLLEDLKTWVLPAGSNFPETIIFVCPDRYWDYVCREMSGLADLIINQKTGEQFRGKEVSGASGRVLQVR